MTFWYSSHICSQNILLFAAIRISDVVRLGGCVVALHDSRKPGPPLFPVRVNVFADFELCQRTHVDVFHRIRYSLASLENEFSGFGAAERTVKVTRKGNSDNPYAEIEDAWTQATPSGTTVATATYNLRTADDLSRLALGSALPPAFQQLPPPPNRIAGGSHSSVMTKSR
jgi:hypothetical protein